MKYRLQHVGLALAQFAAACGFFLWPAFDFRMSLGGVFVCIVTSSVMLFGTGVSLVRAITGRAKHEPRA